MTKAEKILLAGGIIGAIILAVCSLRGKGAAPTVVTAGGTGTVTGTVDIGVPVVKGNSAIAGGTDYSTLPTVDAVTSA